MHNEGDDFNGAEEVGLFVVLSVVQSYPGYPYLCYPKPWLSEHSSERGVCFQKIVFALKPQTLRISSVHCTCVCVSYVHIQCGSMHWYAIVTFPLHTSERCSKGRRFTVVVHHFLQYVKDSCPELSSPPCLLY